MSTPIFVIADQRSGTNLLRSSLASSQQICDLNEIFHPQGGIYWLYREQKLQLQPAWLMPTSEHQIELFEAFLAACLPGEFPFAMLDVKYNSSHTLNEFPRSPIETPRFIQWLIQKQYPVIHLVRENSLESYVSLLVGLHTNNWVVDVAAPRPAPIRLKLDVAETLFQVAKRQRQIKQFRQYLHPANCLELSYRALTDETGEFSDVCVKQICQWLGLRDSLNIRIVTQKSGRPMREIIENYDEEILPALIDLGMGRMVDTEPESESLNGSALPNISPCTDRPVIRIQPQPVFRHVSRIRRVSALSQPLFLISACSQSADVFCQTLAANFDCFDATKIFSAAEDSFWSFRTQQLAARRELSLPSIKNQLEIFETFLDQRLNHDKPFTLIDVPYDFVHSINEAWYAPGTRPVLLAWLLEQKSAIIHLVKDNFFKQESSGSEHPALVIRPKNGLAATGVSMSDRGSANVIQRNSLRRAEVAVMRAWLAPTNQLEIAVESLIAREGDLSATAIRRVAEFIGMVPMFPEGRQSTQFAIPSIR